MKPEIKIDGWPKNFNILPQPLRPVLNILRFVGARLYPFDVETPQTGAEAMLDDYLIDEYRKI